MYKNVCLSTWLQPIITHGHNNPNILANYFSINNNMYLSSLRTDSVPLTLLPSQRSVKCLA